MKRFAHGGGIGGLRHQSQDIASRGRYGDSMLLHVRPDEVSGIESALGRPLSVNPETGNPEAWAVTTSLLVGALLGAGLGAAGGYSQTGDWKGALIGGGLGAVGGAAGGAAGGAGVGAGAGTLATLGAVGSGAASGAGITQALGAPAYAAVAPTPESKTIVDPFVKSSRMQGARGKMTQAMSGMRRPNMGRRMAGSGVTSNRLLG